jgi:flagellar M-ring protein FliF
MEQILKLLSGLSMRQRISIVLAAVLTGAGIFAFAQWKHEGDFRPLYTAMAPEDAAGVVQKLRETGVEYRLSENGGSVLVPSTKLAESRLALAAAGLPKTGRIGFELFDKANFGATEFVEHINYKRALEGELERSVMSLAEVEQSRVHLTLSKESIFLDKQQPAKASVMVKLRPGAAMSQQNVLAITNLVASAVEGLGPEAVSIVDMSGNLLSRPKKSGDTAAFTTESLEITQQMERALVAKIRATLEPVIGPDRFRAGASVECDLTSGEQQEETFDPTRSVMASSQKTEDATERASAAGGVPGTASSLPGSPAPTRAASPGGLSRRTENVTFQTSRLVRQTHIPQGVIRRMSLSVLVDNTVRWEGEGAAKKRILEPPSAETIKTITNLVAAATGLNTTRGDQLIVESLPFESSVNAEPPPGPVTKTTPKPQAPEPAWLQFLRKNRDLILPICGAVALVAFLIFGALRLRTKTKSPKSPKSPPVAPAALAQGAAAAAYSAEMAGAPAGQALSIAGGITSEDSLEVAERVRQLAQNDVAVATNIVRLWLHETETRTV